MDNKTETIYYSLKFIIVGDQSVGKTNILHRYAKGIFSSEYHITIGMDFLSQNIELNNNIFHLQLWDTAGSEKFRSVTRGYFSNSACAIVVYDITNEKSFESVKEWVEECKLYTNKTIHLVLVGNKNDLNEKRKITKEQGKELATEYGMEFYESSALTGDNINEIFVDSCKIIDNNIKNNLYDLNNPSNGIRTYEVEDDMKIDKSYNYDINGTINSRYTLDKKKHKKKQKSKCYCKIN